MSDGLYMYSWLFCSAPTVRPDPGPSEWMMCHRPATLNAAINLSEDHLSGEAWRGGPVPRSSSPDTKDRAGILSHTPTCTTHIPHSVATEEPLGPGPALPRPGLRPGALRESLRESLKRRDWIVGAVAVLGTCSESAH